jgi:hypothetical protein
LINTTQRKRKENGMGTFETALYYFSLSLFIVANAAFWGLLTYGAVMQIREWFVVKKQE